MVSALVDGGLEKKGKKHEANRRSELGGGDGTASRARWYDAMSSCEEKEKNKGGRLGSTIAQDDRSIMTRNALMSILCRMIIILCNIVRVP